MYWYVKRTGQALFTLWAVATISFMLIRFMPGSPEDIQVALMRRENPGRDEEWIRAQVRDQLMIDPDAGHGEAYAQYMGSLLRGDLGQSHRLGDVNSVIAETLPWTVLVMGLATFLLFAISLTLGAIMAYREDSMFDLSNTIVGIFTTSIPYYVAAILLIKYIGFGTPLVEPFGRLPDGVEIGLSLEFVVGAIRQAILPALSYVLTAYGLMALTMRGNSIQVLGKDYVRVARLRGLSDRRIGLRYVGRNAILPMYTTILISIGFMFGGSIILEELFTYRGVGLVMYRSIERLDMPMMMGTFLVITIGVVIAVYIADATYGKLDPRIQSGDEGEAY